MQNEAATVASVTNPRDGRTLRGMGNSEPGPAFDWSTADRRRMPAHLKRKHRKRPSPKPAVTEKVIDEQRQPLTECARSGQPLPARASTGRPRIYRTPACRKAAYEDRRPGRDGAVKVQLVDRVIVQTVERVERVQHPPAECVTMLCGVGNETPGHGRADTNHGRVPRAIRSAICQPCAGFARPPAAAEMAVAERAPALPRWSPRLATTYAT